MDCQLGFLCGCVGSGERVSLSKKGRGETIEKWCCSYGATREGERRQGVKGGTSTDARASALSLVYHQSHTWHFGIDTGCRGYKIRKIALRVKGFSYVCMIPYS